MRLTRAFLPDMIAHKGGHIVNISSVAGLIGVAGFVPYCAAKFGLRGFGDALYAEVWKNGIDVTTVYPYVIGSDPVKRRVAMGDGIDQARPPLLLGRRLLHDTDFIAAQVLRGITKRRRHVYPGAVPKVIEGVRRFAPWVFPLNRFRALEFAWRGRG
jgi:3-dehydrosphinganine reductase